MLVSSRATAFPLFLFPLLLDGHTAQPDRGSSHSKELLERISPLALAVPALADLHHPLLFVLFLVHRLNISGTGVNTGIIDSITAARW